MPRLFQPLRLLLASTADSKLAPVVEYLKAENQILRAKCRSHRASGSDW